MLIRNLVGPPRRVVELWCCGVGAVVFVFFSYHVVELFWLSFTFGDRSRGENGGDKLVHGSGGIS